MARSARVTKQERLEILRRMFLEGLAEYKIRQRMVRDGLTLPDGRVVKVTRATFRRDLEELAGAYRRMSDDPAYQERVVGAVLERLIRIAIKAESKGQFHAAISANMKVIDVVGMRTPRWRKGSQEDRPGETGATTMVAADRVSDLSDAELAAELRGLEGRLRVLDGGVG